MILKFLLLVFCLVAGFYSSACSCIGKQSVSEAFKASDLVVSARIIHMQEVYELHDLEYTIVVESSFKGAKAGDTLKIRTGHGGGDCGFPFAVGREYLIYAVPEYSKKKSGRSGKKLQGIFSTNICQRTRSIENAEEDLIYLKPR